MPKQTNGKRLLFIGNYLIDGRSSIAVGEGLAKVLIKRGWTVVKTSTIHNKVLRLADMLASVLFKSSQYDLAQVDVFSGPAFRWAEAVTKLLSILGKPIVLTLHGGHLPEFSKKNPERVKRLMNRADHVTAPSSYLAKNLQPYRENIEVLPNPIDLKCYPFTKRSQAGPTLIWLRAIHRIYNPNMAIHTLARLREEDPSYRLLMIGPDKQDGSLQECKDLVRELKQEDAVEFTGGVNKNSVPKWLKKGDIFLNTTTVDNTPVSVLEAMAAGCCIVSTAVGGIPDMLDDGENAILVPSNDHKMMAQAIHNLRHSSELTSKLSSASRAFAIARDYDLIVDRWEKVFRSSLTQKAHHGLIK